jgi:hypothetical protein
MLRLLVNVGSIHKSSERGLVKLSDPGESDLNPQGRPWLH